MNGVKRTAGLLGRRAPLGHPREVKSAAALALLLRPLGAPPSASVDRISVITGMAGGWRMLLNDQLGCCTCSDSGHSLMLRTQANGSIIIPTDADIQAMYQNFGYVPGQPATDQGAAETDVCDWLKSTGLLGHKLDDYTSLDSTDIDGLKWAVELFGSCRLGINLPNSAIDQFNNGQPWDTVPDDGGIVGRHDVLLVGYDDDHFTVITWGMTQLMTRAFFVQYREEAHPELAFDWIAANGRAPSGFDLAALVSAISSDLSSISNA